VKERVRWKENWRGIRKKRKTRDVFKAELYHIFFELPIKRDDLQTILS